MRTITTTTTLADVAEILGREAGEAVDPWSCADLRAAADYLRSCRARGIAPARDCFGISDDMQALLDLVAGWDRDDSCGRTLLASYSLAAHDAEDAAILVAADEVEEMADLIDIYYGETVREATVDERWASHIAQRHDGGRGAILVDGRTCYAG